MKNNLPFFLFTLLFVISGNTDAKDKNSLPSESNSTATENSTAVSQQNAGMKVFMASCMPCHMANGSGVPKMFPPLVESEVVNGDPEKLITIILEGLKGEIKVKGEVYNNVMIPQPNLTDQQIADVLTYIRSNFGNSADPVSPEDVKKLRK